MAGFNIKQGDTQPPLYTTLTDANGDLLDLTGKTVTLRVKAMVAPYTYVEYVATPDVDQVTNKGLASYDWAAGGTAVPGDFWLEWVVQNEITLPTVGFNRLVVWESLTDNALPAMGPVVTLDDVETMLGRVLTSNEAQRALSLIDELTATVEGILHRDVRVKRRTEVGFIPPTGRFYPHWGPVILVEAFTLDASDVLVNYLADPSTWYRPGARWTCTYVSGMSLLDRAVAVGIITKGVTAVILAPAQAAAGVLQSYSVEGTSITYGSALTGGQGNVGRFTVADVAALGLRRKPIIG